MRFLFLMCGLVLGGFALLIGQNLGLITPGRPPAGRRPIATASAAETTDAQASSAARERTPQDVARERAAVEKEMAARRRKSLEPLAALLNEALVQQDWNKVEAVADAMTAHGGDWVEAPPPPSGPPALAEPEERSLWQLREEVDRRTRERDEARSRTAAAAIARGGDPRSKERLLDILRSPGPVEERFDAALWLVKSGDEPAIQELVRMLSSDDHILRAASAAALGREGMVSGLSELERLARLGATAEVRMSAVDGLVAFRAVRSGEAVSAATTLVQALRADTAEEVRARAAASLFQTDLERFPLFADALVEALARDPSARVRAAAARPDRLASLDDAVADRLSGAIVQALATETDPSVATVFVNSLAEVGDRDAALALERFGGTATGAALAQPISIARERILARAPQAGAPPPITLPASTPATSASGTIPGSTPVTPQPPIATQGSTPAPPQVPPGAGAPLAPPGGRVTPQEPIPVPPATAPVTPPTRQPEPPPAPQPQQPQQPIVPPQQPIPSQPPPQPQPPQPQPVTPQQPAPAQRTVAPRR